ncbi:nitronate monooxygenase [Priestia koreensis]|nr:nitronate monooxygenase [Priestia koreensis]
MKMGTIQKELSIAYPIFQAGMAGGITTPELVAAVSNFGAFGQIGAGYLTAEALRDAIREVKKRTNKPFGVNLFVPEPTRNVNKSDIEMMNERLSQISPAILPVTDPSGDQHNEEYVKQIEVVVEEGVTACSFTFGSPQLDVIHCLKAEGIKVIGTATTVEEGMMLEESGVHYVVAQGSEAGGHRGTFPTTKGDALIGTIALVPQMADHLHIPVIAAGGIADKRGIEAAYILGAEGVQLGSIFLPCTESGSNPTYKRTLLAKTESDTALTKAFSGKWARGIQNEFMEKMKEVSVLPYPLQNTLTKALRAKAAKDQDPEKMSLWAGQALRLITAECSVAEVLTKLTT